MIDRQVSAEIKGYVIDRLKEREIIQSGDSGNSQTIKLGPMFL